MFFMRQVPFQTPPVLFCTQPIKFRRRAVSPCMRRVKGLPGENPDAPRAVVGFVSYVGSLVSYADSFSPMTSSSSPSRCTATW